MAGSKTGPRRKRPKLAENVKKIVATRTI